MSNDMSVSFLIRLLDQFSAPGQKIRQTMRNIGGSANQMRSALGRKIRVGFSEANLQAALQRNERNIAASRSRLMGAGAMAVTIAAPVMKAGNFEEEMIHFGNLAEIGKDRLALLKTELDQLRGQTGKSNNELLAGLETYVGKGMGLDDALASMRATGRAATATRSEMAEMAGSGFAVMDNLKVAPDQLAQAFDIMAKSGKEGSFELAAMARKFPEITAGAKSLGMEGTESVASLAAALQIAMKSAGSEDQAATNMTNFLGKITAPDTVRKFKSFGVDVESEMKGALERGVDPLEHMLFKIEEMTGGDAFKMGQIFADKQVLDFLRAMIPNMQEYQRIKGEALGAEGVIDADYERVVAGFNHQVRELKASITSLMGASGALLPIMTDIVGDIRVGVDAVAAWTQANPELTATIVKGGAALLAFGVATRVGSFAFHTISGGALRAAGLFLKFNKEGRNISLVARSLRGARAGVRGLFRAVSAPVRWGLRPLRWTSRLVPKIPWARLAGGRFGLSRLLTPVRWGARLIPVIGWVGLTGGRFALASLITPIKWGSRLIPAIGWAVLTGGRFALSSLVTPVKWSARMIPAIGWAARVGAPFKLASMVVPLKWTSRLLPSFGPAIAAFAGLRRDASREITGLADHVDRKSNAMRRSMRRMKWSAVGAGLGILAAMSQVPKDPEDWAQFQQQNRDALDQNLRAVPGIGHLMRGYEGLRDKIHSDEGATPDGIAAVLPRYSSVYGRPATVSVPTADLRAYLAERTSTAAPLTAPSPPARPHAPLVAPSPPARPYAAEQPNVTVQSTFEGQSSVAVDVAVSMPVHITKEVRANNAEIARQAGDKVGAETERAVRRALDDAAGME